MTLKPEKLILDRDKLIESIWQYRWWILDNSNAMIITVIQEKQYKRPSGKHVDIQATDIIKAKNKGYSEWRAVRRGYKDIYKWYCVDSNQIRIKGRGIPGDIFPYMFNKHDDFRDYTFLLSLDYDDLIGLSFALTTYLSRYQPLKKGQDTFYDTFRAEERLQYHFMKEIEDISLRSIRLKLKEWAEDDTDELEEEMAFNTFFRLHKTREGDYMGIHYSHAFYLSLWIDDGYYEHVKQWENIIPKRLEYCKSEAEHYWKHGTSKEHLQGQRLLFFGANLEFSKEKIEKDRKRISKARRKNKSY